ncbi:hypothetical protein [Acinetobacter gyllenbergii]|uniref:hypothetical protein n=1 Tax=Acinetobacter gyllenbergii TaxID=134534 RepID=UPI003AF90263
MSEDIVEEYQFKETHDLLDGIKVSIRDRIFSYSGESDDDIEALEYDIDDKILSLEELIPEEEKDIGFFSLNSNFINRKLKSLLFVINDETTNINTRENLHSILHDVYYGLDEIEKIIDLNLNVNKINELYEKSLKNEHGIRAKIESVDTLLNYLRQDQSHKIYVGEAEKFKKLAFIYESCFYLLIFFMFIYFSGLTIYISDFNFFGVHVGFPPKLTSTGNINFYIQKISVLVLSSTLAGFLLKISFMNRALYQEAYRMAQELNALPPYIQSFSQEIQDKIRLDLTYKYFGKDYNSNHNNENGSDNFMAENIKANTEFLKALKELDSSKSTEKG